MADTALQVVVSPFLGVFFENLSSLIQREFGIMWGVEKEMQKLCRTLCVIRDVLDDAEERQVNDKAIRGWLSELKDAAYDADDALDECTFEGLHLASEMRKNSFTNQVTDSLKQIKFRRKIGKRIKEIRERFDEIAQERIKFHLQKGSVVKPVELYQGRETSSKLTESKVYGRDEDKQSLVTLLLNNVNGQDDISIYPIVGIGGIGKTTVAQMVYNDAEVAEHFQVRAWVCVSQEFDVKRIIKAIVACLSGNVCDLEELDPLEHRLHEELCGVRFLIVLDDVWNEKQDEWDKLSSSFRSGARGSSVIVTTRLETVASIASPLPAYRLKVLSEDDCWSLFKQRAFGLGNEERPDLVEIGMEIVKKCGGVPLAAKALGGLMRFKSDTSEWLFVRDSEIWDLPENNILPALRLSYNHLSSHLRQCFAYCCIFPKGSTIKKEELIQLWMANGMLRSKGKMELEDVGNEVFNELLWRSFFQDIKKDEGGSIETCRMHDLVVDLACHIAADEGSVMNIEKPKVIRSRTRHLSLVSSTQAKAAVASEERESSFGPEEVHSTILESVQSSSQCLRSLILLGGWPRSKKHKIFFSSFIRLRALDLRSSEVTELPYSIGRMKHLRYLNLSQTRITSLHESICRLKNMQSLILKGCYDLYMLPKDMRKMSSLRHLDIEGCYGLTEMPVGIGQLTCLQMLRFFIVGLESGRGINELRGLNLGGYLEIKGLENVKTLIDAKEAYLTRKPNLRTLELAWSHSQEHENATEVIEGLKPHSNVRRLSIEWYKGVTFPCWLTVSSLPNLVEVSLSMCRRCENLPPLGRLPILKVLKIGSLDSVKFIDNEIYEETVEKGFPSLEVLELVRMPNLEGWLSSPQGAEGALFPSLESLTVEECPKLTGIPLSLPCLKSLTLTECPELTEIPVSLSRLNILTLAECPKLEGIPLSPSLQHVKVRACNEMVLRSLQNLHCLSYLEIVEFDQLQYFPEVMLREITSLQELNIEYCNSLQALPVELENLTSLTRLVIYNCRQLVSLPEGMRHLSALKSLTIGRCHSLTTVSDRLRHLTALEILRIQGCPELEFSDEDFQHLVVLQRLTLDGLPKLTCFPEGLKHAVMVQDLSIERCPDILYMPEWIGSLTSLHTLELHGCKNLKVLPEGMQLLTALQHLKIYECDSELEKRCKKEIGEDWFKISHVPNITIQRKEFSVRY